MSANDLRLLADSLTHLAGHASCNLCNAASHVHVVHRGLENLHTTK